MKIIVCIKEVIDPKLNLDFGLTNRVIFREGKPFKLDPSDAKSIELALNLKAQDPQSEITLLSIGPERVERYLRDGLALGADKAIRIWDEGSDTFSPYNKAKILTRVVATLRADIVLTGSRSLDTGDGQVGPLMAGWLGWPCAGEVTSLEPEQEKNAFAIIKDDSLGEVEKIQCFSPFVITVKGEGRLQYASLDGLIESKHSEVKVFTLAELGFSTENLKTEPVTLTGLLFPKPAPMKAPSLDSSLPAFYRVIQLMEAGITRRKSLMLQGNSTEITEQLFELLKEQGVFQTAQKS